MIDQELAGVVCFEIGRDCVLQDYYTILTFLLIINYNAPGCCFINRANHAWNNLDHQLYVLAYFRGQIRDGLPDGPPLPGRNETTDSCHRVKQASIATPFAQTRPGDALISCFSGIVRRVYKNGPICFNQPGATAGAVHG